MISKVLIRYGYFVLPLIIIAIFWEFDKEYNYLFTKLIFWLSVLYWLVWKIKKSAFLVTKGSRVKRVLLFFISGSSLLFVGGWDLLGQYNFSKQSEIIETKILKVEEKICTGKRNKYNDFPCWDVIFKINDNLMNDKRVLKEKKVGQKVYIQLRSKNGTNWFENVSPLGSKKFKIFYNPTTPSDQFEKEDSSFPTFLLSLGFAFFAGSLRWLSVLNLPFQGSLRPESKLKKNVFRGSSQNNKERIEPTLHKK